MHDVVPWGHDDATLVEREIASRNDNAQFGAKRK